MPIITNQGRPSIGGEGTPAPHRPTVKVSTGINPSPRTEAPATQPAPQVGQSSVKEETQPQAVTLSPQLSALAREQQKLQQKIQAQRDREAEWEAKQADFVPKSSIKAKAQQNAQEALMEAMGMNYEELTQLLLSQSSGDDPVKNLASRFDQFEKSQEEKTNKQYEATLKQYRRETDSLVAEDPRAYHFITKQGLQDAVVEHIVETWEEDPDQVLTVAQAAKEVEEALRENAKAAADALRELDPPAEVPAKDSKQTLPPPRKEAAAPKTLTQQVETAPTRTYGQFQHLSMKERIAQATARAQR